MTTLNELLSMPRYSDLILLTEPNTADTPVIKSVEISETPDIEHYIPNGTVLLTTGMIYENNQFKLKSLIDSLVRAEARGLGIKVNRFIHQVKPEIIEHANQLNFPIFQIPDHYNLGTILHQWLNIVWDQQHEEIAFALDIQKVFQNLVVQDASLHLFINEFSQLIKSPVILLDSFYEIITYSNHFKGQSHRLDDFVKQIRLKSQNSKEIFRSYLIKDHKQEPIQITLRSLSVRNYLNDYLVILNPEQIPNPLNHFAIDQAALALSFVLMKNDKVHQLELTTEADFFKDWMEDRLPLNSAGNKYGFTISDYYQVIKITDLNRMNRSGETTISHKENLWLITLWLEKSLPNIFKKAKVIYSASNWETLILLQQKTSGLKNSLEKLAWTLNKRTGINIAFNAGEPVKQANMIEKSLTQARITHDERIASKNTTAFLAYEGKGIRQLFSSVDDEQVNFFIRNTLGPFADLDDTSLSDLRKTLHVYLSCQCEIAQTANKLYVHRNTVKYRIQKCEDILQQNVSEPENSLNLRIALSLLEEKSPK